MKHCALAPARRITLVMGEFLQSTVAKSRVLLTVFCLALPGLAQPADKHIMGWLEYVEIHPLDFRVKAKLDTGAKTSSIHAKDIETFKRNGKTWVRFTFEALDRKNKDSKKDKVRKVTLERKRVRNVVIKRHNTEYQKRPVVELTLCMNGQLHTEQFSLIDRSRFLYPVLLGRRALKDMAIVDPGERYLTTPNCSEAEEKD